MKYVKRLGLAAITAAVLMAFVGASAASATVLCKNGTTTTTCSEPYGEVTFEAEQTKAVVIHTVFKTIECKNFHLVAALSSGGSTKTVSGSTTLTFGECNCDVTMLKGGTLELHQISGTDNSTITMNGQELTVSCSTVLGTVHCIYVTENDDFGSLLGGNPATSEVSVSVRRLATNSLCQEEAIWTLGYKVTAPAPLFVSAG